MNRLFCILHIFLFSLLAWSQEKDYSLSYSLKDYNFIRHDGVLYIKSYDFSSFYKANPKEPALPISVVKILVGPNQSYESFTYTREESLVYEDVSVNYNPIAVPADCVKNYKPYTESEISYNDQSYPQTFITYQSTQLIGGYKCLCFYVSPFRYDAVSKKLYINKFQLHVILSSKDSSQELQIGHNMRTAVQHTVINPEELQHLYPISPMRQSIIGSIADTEDYEYLIITSNSLLNSFQNLADWKTMRGVRTKILTVNEIYQNYQITQSGNYYSPNTIKCMKIKRAIQDYGDNHQTKYVLLGGDVNLVPSLDCHITGPYVAAIGQEYESITPADYYYSTFNDIDWTNNLGENQLWFDYDSITCFPEIFVSRISVENASEADNYISRLIEYEQEGWCDSVPLNILMSGDTLYYVHNGQIDAEYFADSIYSTFITPYSGLQRYKFFHSYYGQDTILTGMNAANLQLAMADCHHFIDLNTHGSEYQIKTGQDHYTVTNAAAFQNPIKSIITTGSCNTNTIDSSNPCLSEVIMRNPNSGILGYLGSSDKGWTYTVPHYLSTSERYSGEFYKRMFDYVNNTSFHFAEIATTAKLFLIDCMESLPEARCLLLSINPLGDPEMPISQNTSLLEFSTEEGENQVIVNYTDSMLTVQVPDTSCRITVFSSEDIGRTYYAQTEGQYSASFLPPLIQCTISVTCPDYKPFLYDGIYKPLYIQNEVMSGDVSLRGVEAFIGSDVTTQKPLGPVTIQSGKTLINVARGATIKNNFTVNAGAEFSIKTQ